MIFDVDLSKQRRNIRLRTIFIPALFARFNYYAEEAVWMQIRRTFPCKCKATVFIQRTIPTVCMTDNIFFALQWRHNGHDSVSTHQRLYCLLNRFYGRRSKKTSKLRITGLCEGDSPGTGEFPPQMASNAENVSIWWRHHGYRDIYDWILDFLDSLC